VIDDAQFQESSPSVTFPLVVLFFSFGMLSQVVGDRLRLPRHRWSRGA
jgi:hypothetical protein